jgi:hypothetical protein
LRYFIDNIVVDIFATKFFPAHNNLLIGLFIRHSISIANLSIWSYNFFLNRLNFY